MTDPATRAGELRQIATTLLEMADALEAEPMGPLFAVPHRDRLRISTQEDLALQARQVRTRRELRRNHFDKELIGEPAWEMLLDLYLAKVESEQVTVSSICDRSHASQTTARRYLDLLKLKGLVDVFPFCTEKDDAPIELSSKGFHAISRYLHALESDDLIKSKSLNT